MRKLISALYIIGLALPVVIPPPAEAEASPVGLTWKQLPSLRDANGFAGAYAGISGGALMVAGGANFPEAMPWQGGQKVWHDSVFVMPRGANQWLSGFKLPHSAAYGVSLSTSSGVLCAGGSNERGHSRNVFLLSWEEGKVQTKALPALPWPLANGCGALLGHTIYLAGGTETPDATNALKNFWSLDLSGAEPRWRELESWPGPARMLSVAAVLGGEFFLVSGVELSGDVDGKPVRRYLKDAYRFRAGGGWRRIADLPCATAAAPSPAPALGDSTFLILGGDDGSKIGFQPPERHPGFPRTILAYDASNDSWKPLGKMPVAHVTTPTVKWDGGWVLPSGEVRPGVRSPEVWAVHPGER